MAEEQRPVNTMTQGRLMWCDKCMLRPDFLTRGVQHVPPNAMDPRVLAWALMTQDKVAHEQTGYAAPKGGVRARQTERLGAEKPAVVNVAFEMLTHNDRYAIQFIRQMVQGYRKGDALTLNGGEWPWTFSPLRGGRSS